MDPYNTSAPSTEGQTTHHETNNAGAESKIHQQHGRGGGGALSFRLLALGVVLVSGVLAGYWTLAQSTPPVLTIAPTGTNQLLITVTNGVAGTGSYEVWTTPVLGDVADYPWTGAAMGTNGQTNFVLNIPPYTAGFYQVILDTNVPPLWEAADPHNPSAGILTIWIDSPANGSTLN